MTRQMCNMWHGEWSEHIFNPNSRNLYAIKFLEKILTPFKLNLHHYDGAKQINSLAPHYLVLKF